MKELNSKRTFIFARAGYGKSNLMKVIASKWKTQYGGLCIFDPEGEYAITDAKGRPGIMDTTEAILVTNRKINKDIKNVYDKLKINFKDFPAQMILPIIINESKHSNIFFMKLMGLDQQNWSDLVDLLQRDGFRADDDAVCAFIGLQNDESVGPIKNNLVPAIRDLHDPDSKLINIIVEALKQGHVIIVDISLIDSKSALNLSSIIVNHIFNQNQRHFTSSEGETLINATFVVEEAQSVLSNADLGSFVELAKEGRKYHLGGIFVTQQPNSIPFEIMSQGDNFFVFHLLSKGDLQSLQKANAHYSDDIITQILNEPIRGKCYMWTSHQPFVIPVSVNNFESGTVVNNSEKIQSKSKLLKDIEIKINEEFTNPTFINIISKYREVETEYIGKDPKNKTVSLFRKLDEGEKEYLRTRGNIQVTRDGVEFAIRTVYYHELERYSRNLDR